MDNQKKKILLVITKSNFGGAQKYVFELAKSLHSRGYNVKVALGGEGILCDKLRNAGIPIISIPYLGRDISLGADVKVFFELYKILHRERPDVVHLNSSKIGGIGALASRLAHIPTIIFTIHGWAFNEDRGMLAKLAIKLSYLATLILSTRAIAVSEATKRDANSIPLHSLVNKKISVIHNGITVPEFLSRDTARAFLSKHLSTDLTHKIIIGQIAELHPVKSISTTIEAAQKITAKNPNTVFVLIGGGQEHDKLRAQIDSLGLTHKVFLAGFIDAAAQYMKAFECFCLTSTSEALGLVLLEAGLARVPVVASRVGGIPELITDRTTGLLFSARNSDELRAAIEQALSLSQEDKAAMTEAFFTTIQEKFLIERMIDKTLEYYWL